MNTSTDNLFAMKEMKNFRTVQELESSQGGPKVVSWNTTEAIGADRIKSVTIAAPNTSERSTGRMAQFTRECPSGSTSKHIFETKSETGYSSDDDSDVDEFRKPNYKEAAVGKISGSCSSGGSGTTSGSDERFSSQNANRKADYYGQSDENILHIPSLNTVQVITADCIFSLVIFLVHLGEFLSDFTLVCWHFADGFKWESALTGICMMSGAIGLLQQFNLMQRDHLVRLFEHGKRIRIIVNCFPPLSTIITSYQSAVIGARSIKNPMLSNQFFEIEEFSKSLSKVQSFFQAAPQVTLQLIVLLHSIHEISLAKGIFTLVTIVISLTVMTNATLPLKSDYQGSEPIHRAAYIPGSRLFVGLRMLSSFASRSMAITYFVIGFRCLLAENTMLNAVVVVFFALFVPRLVFTAIDYARLLVTSRNLQQSRNAPGDSRAIPDNQSYASFVNASFFDTLLGYIATIFFPVSDPLWIFWYIWAETALFVMFGNVCGWANSCVTTLVNSIYTSVFIILFIVVPILIPYAKATIKVRRMKRLDKIFDWRNSVPTTNEESVPNPNNTFVENENVLQQVSVERSPV